MQEPLDALRYTRYLWRRRVWIAASAGLAAAIALTISLAMTREYTAAVRVVIEPPAGADQRAATAVSPIYLESLRTYEQFASSDTLFATAAGRFQLRSLYSKRPLESLKKHVLKVQILRNTRILEIGATLPDPVKAQALAQFVAESTVSLSRSTIEEGDRELVAGFEKQQRDARRDLDAVEAEYSRTFAQGPIFNLRAEMEQDESLARDLEQQRLAAERDASAARSRAAAAAASVSSPAAANAAELLRQLTAIRQRNIEREKLLADRQARLDRLDAERKSLRTSLSGIEGRLREARGEAGYRGERLNIIDPGVVPEKPSSPNLPLNVGVALLLGLFLSTAYFTVEMQFHPENTAEKRSFRAYVPVHDD